MRFVVALSAFLVAIFVQAARADGGPVYRSEYNIFAVGIRIGKTSFDAEIEPDSYKVKGSFHASGLAALFSSASGKLGVVGQIGKDGAEARDFTLAYKSGNRGQRTEIGFSGETVSRAFNAPKVKKRGQWIEVEEPHLRHTVDPLTALLVHSDSLRNVCGRTLRVFDGSMRADIELSYLRTIPFSTKGFKGNAVTCRAKFLPISGYRKDESDLVWMRDNSIIDISFAPIEGTSFFAPVMGKIGTKIGPVKFYASRFERLSR